MFVVIIGILLLIWIVYKSKHVENFVSNYYELNWTAPDLIDYINVEKAMPSKVCDKDLCTYCTYSMSCDYTDDGSNHNCFKGYDIPSATPSGLINNTI